jgi:DNA polymerase zeta
VQCELPELTAGICEDCTSDPATTAHALLSRQHIAQSKLVDTHKLCASCSGTPVSEKVLCDSVDCPVLYAKVAAERDAEDLGDVDELVARLKDDGGRSGGLDW